jgi:hypothetical protein
VQKPFTHHQLGAGDIQHWGCCCSNEVELRNWRPLACPERVKGQGYPAEGLAITRQQQHQYRRAFRNCSVISGTSSYSRRGGQAFAHVTVLHAHQPASAAQHCGDQRNRYKWCATNGIIAMQVACQQRLLCMLHGILFQANKYALSRRRCTSAAISAL